VRDDGTAASAFDGFPIDRIDVGGKSGTAQMKPKQPFSWFAAIAKTSTKQIVVVALVEESGSGSLIAAPIVRKVLEQYFDIRKAKFKPGSAAD
jgi:penicillin-binding protein 2